MAMLEKNFTPKQIEKLEQMYGLTGAELATAVSVDVTDMLKMKWWQFLTSQNLEEF